LFVSHHLVKRSNNKNTMQQRVILALAFLVAPIAGLSASQSARLFLRSHVANPPKVDELAELNRENPEAYALVKALLTKRSLGLLDPKHPTASFAGPTAEQRQNQEAVEQGPEAFAKFASPGELESHGHQESLVGTTASVALPYANVGSAHADVGLNWKPQDGGLSDEQMVQNLLGAVAQLKGGKKSGLLSKQRGSESALSSDESSFEAEPVAAPVQAPVARAAPVSHENSYLKTVDFGLNTPETVAAPVEKSAPHKNSYLDGLDLTGDMPRETAPAATKKISQSQQSSSNALSSFSWGDEKPKEQEQPDQSGVAELVKADGKSNSLLGWLGVVQKAPAPKVEAPAPPSNPYLMDLSN